MWTSEVVELIRESGIVNKEFEFFPNETQFMQIAAKTPRSNCVLDSTKAIHTGLKLTPIRDSIKAMLQSWESLPLNA
jgi:hypothetical protein